MTTTRAHRLIWSCSTLLWSFVVSCGPTSQLDERSSALNALSYPENLFVPAYFSAGSAAKSRAALQNTSYNGVAVVNFGAPGGPGAQPSGPDDPNYQWVQSLRNNGTIVLGYVDNDYARPSAFVLQDILAWEDWYPIDGIFFDVSARDLSPTTILDSPSTQADDMGQMEYFQQYVVDTLGTIAPVAFNWGTTFDEQQYVYCSETQANTVGQPSSFGTFEGSEATFQMDVQTQDAIPGWLTQYQPNVFFQIVNDASIAANLSTDMQYSRENWNASNVYVTDLPASNPYSDLVGYQNESQPNTTEWTSEVAISNAGPQGDYPSNTTLASFSCPATPTEPPMPVPYWTYAFGSALL